MEIVIWLEMKLWLRDWKLGGQRGNESLVVVVVVGGRRGGLLTGRGDFSWWWWWWFRGRGGMSKFSVSGGLPPVGKILFDAMYMYVCNLSVYLSIYLSIHLFTYIRNISIYISTYDTWTTKVWVWWVLTPTLHPNKYLLFICI